LEDKINDLSKSTVTIKDHLRSVKELYAQLDGLDSDKLIDMRRRIKAHIAQLIKEIKIYPDGMKGRVVEWTGTNWQVKKYKPIIPSQVRDVETLDNSIDREVAEQAIQTVQYEEMTTGRQKRAFLVWFKNGYFRAFGWDGEAKEYRVEAEESGNGVILFGQPVEKGIDPLFEKALDAAVSKHCLEGGKLPP